jgi:hypothetical protein
MGRNSRPTRHCHSRRMDNGRFTASVCSDTNSTPLACCRFPTDGEQARSGRRAGRLLGEVEPFSRCLRSVRVGMGSHTTTGSEIKVSGCNFDFLSPPRPSRSPRSAISRNISLALRWGPRRGPFHQPGRASRITAPAGSRMALWVVSCGVADGRQPRYRGSVTARHRGGTHSRLHVTANRTQEARDVRRWVRQPAAAARGRLPAKPRGRLNGRHPRP